MEVALLYDSNHQDGENQLDENYNTELNPIAGQDLGQIAVTNDATVNHLKIIH